MYKRSADKNAIALARSGRAERGLYLDENIIRDFGLLNGLVDVKVCAVDDVWSGLKFVVRVKDR